MMMLMMTIMAVVVCPLSMDTPSRGISACEPEQQRALFPLQQYYYSTAGYTTVLFGCPIPTVCGTIAVLVRQQCTVVYPPPLGDLFPLQYKPPLSLLILPLEYKNHYEESTHICKDRVAFSQSMDIVSTAYQPTAAPVCLTGLPTKLNQRYMALKYCHPPTALAQHHR